MRYAQLYEYANGLNTDAISVRDLAAQICAHADNDIGEVHFWAVALDANISLGHIKFERDRGSAYDAPFRIANIRYDQGQNRCWRRYICCKELMHVFDSDAERVNTRERFLRLMDELQSLRMKEDMSPMFYSELEAQWMAVLVLCPERLRNKFKPLWDAKTMSDLDVALKLKVPEILIKSIMSDYYTDAMNRLLRNDRQRAG